VTAVAGHVTAGRPAPVLPPADAPGSGRVPRLAEGVELLGEYQGSGYSQPPSLVRRADGQVIQMSALLYRVACRIDGSRDPAAIAGLVSEDLGRSLTADQVRYLVTAKLLPLGVVAAEGVPAAAPKANPLLALRARGTLLSERAANAAGALLVNTVMVTNCGRICIGKRKINLSQVFSGQLLGIREVDEKIWLVSFLDFDLGYFDEVEGRVEPGPNPFAAKVLTMPPG